MMEWYAVKEYRPRIAEPIYLVVDGIECEGIYSDSDSGGFIYCLPGQYDQKWISKRDPEYNSRVEKWCYLHSENKPVLI